MHLLHICATYMHTYKNFKLFEVKQKQHIYYKELEKK